MDQKKYDIGGKTYIQRPLVWGQILQILDILKRVTIPVGLNALSLVIALREHLSAALAVVLTPEGAILQAKDLAALAAEIEFAITPEQIFEVVEDFFVCNPLPLFLDRLGMAAGMIMGQMQRSTQSTPSASSLPEATSPAGTESSGDSPLPSAGPGSNGGAGKSSSGRR